MSVVYRKHVNRSENIYEGVKTPQLDSKGSIVYTVYVTFLYYF